MRCDVRLLTSGEALESHVVLVNDVEAVGDLHRPEVEIGNVPRKLVWIQRHETGELRREFFGDGDGVGGEG